MRIFMREIKRIYIYLFVDKVNDLSSDSDFSRLY